MLWLMNSISTFVNISQSLAEKSTPTHNFNFHLKNRIDRKLRFTLVDEEHIVGIFNRLKISKVMVIKQIAQICQRLSN